MYPKYSNDELLKLIKEKQISRKELHDRYRKQYKELQILNPEIEKFLKWIPPIQYSELFNSPEAFQKFINENKFENSSQLEQRFPGIAANYRKNRGGIKDKIVWAKPAFSWKRMTVEELQNFIDEHKIQNRYDFSIKFPKLYVHSRDNWKIIDQVVFPIETTYGRWESYNTVNDFQKFVNENKITGKKDFNLRFRGLWQRARNRNFLKDLQFVGDPVYDSLWEKNLVEFLRSSINIPEQRIKTHTILSDCVDKGSLILDIEIKYKEVKIAIEIQGPYHFNTPFNKIEKYITNRKHDIMKKRYLESKEYHVFFFSYSRDLVYTYGYPYYVYLKEDELLKDIKMLIGIP